MNNDIQPDFVHPEFKLNGIHFSADDLCHAAICYFKEGDGYQQAIGTFILEWFDGNDYVQMQTSGTTGTPKPIKAPKQAMVNSALATGTYFNLDAGTKALHCLPAQYVAGKLMLVRAFLLGWDMDIVEPNSKPLDGNDTVYDFSAMVPLQAQHSIDKLDRVKKIILGGAKVNSALAEQLQTLKTEVYETYGMTETITHIAAKRIGDNSFEALPGVTFTSDDRNCLIIKAPRVTTESVVTNDVIEIIDSTHFIWLGRHDNVINSGGVKLFPEQIEEKLATYIPNRFFVSGITDETLGEKLVLIIEGAPYTIDDSVFAELSKFEKPKEILFADAFAETGSGKVQRDKTLQNIRR
jgi:O-succinylbenzoic acid--CoA ligase